MSLSFSELLIVLLLIGAAAFWWNGLRKKEMAGQLAAAACRRSDVQFLDETVSLTKISFERDRGQLKLARSYRFEFSVTGTERRLGTVVILGNRQKYLHMDLPGSRVFTVVPGGMD